MRRKKIGLALLASAMVAGAFPATAATIVSNGSPTWGLNWGTYGPLDFSGSEWYQNQVTVTPNSGYRTAAGVNDGDPSDVPTAGGGGQNYDAESIFYYFDSSTNALHLGLITGFNPWGEVGDFRSPFYRAGDIFVDIGGDGEFELAIGTARGGSGTNTESTSRAGSAWYNAGSSSWIAGRDDLRRFGDPLGSVDGLWGVSHITSPDHTDANPFRVDETDAGNVDLLSNTVNFAQSRLWEDTSIASGSSGPYATGQTNYNRERWFYEFQIILDPNNFDLASLTDPNGGIGLHWTMGCGNDAITVLDSDNPFASVVPVPAAAPLGLLGMIALGLFRKVRAKKS